MGDGDPTLAGAFTGPVYIVTAFADGRRAGAWSASRRRLASTGVVHGLHRARTRTFAVAMAAPRLCVHAVTERERGWRSSSAARRGTRSTSSPAAGWTPAGDGTPILSDCPTWFLGRVADRVDLGDHVGYVLEPERWQGGGPIAQLSERDLAGVEPGHPA